MPKFSPAMLIPASQVSEFSKGCTGSIKDTVLNNINKMKELFQQPDAEGKRNFEVKNNVVKFSIRVNNTALVLGQVEGEGGAADVKEMSIASENFLEALSWYSDRVKGGEFDAQLTALDAKREARTTKMRSTRAAKKEAKPAK